MDGAAIAEALSVDLDVLGQQAGFNGLYTQLSSCFSVTDDSSYATIIGTLERGLERLAASFPYLAGQVVKRSVSDGEPDIFKIIPLEKTPRFVVKDLRDDASVPTMEDLRKARFPMNMLDENMVAPRNTLPDGSHPDAPVFLVQATFIAGGLILTFVGQHNVMDMTGQGEIISLFSKACHGQNFTDEELSAGSVAREDLVPLLEKSYQPGEELKYYIAKQAPSKAISDETEQPSVQLPPSKCSWATFIFEPASLAQLKLQAIGSLTQGFVSTDDVLTAFIWQSIGRARLPRNSVTNRSTLARAVDVRRYLNISPAYHGLMQNMTYATRTFEQLVNESLGTLASELRSAVDPKTSNLAYATRALTTYFVRASASDRSNVSITASLDIPNDIMLSSWSKVNTYDLDFNLRLGKPEAVRRPHFVPVESLIYLMPKRPDGEIAVTICLTDDDMDRLKADEDFTRYGVYVG